MNGYITKVNLACGKDNLASPLYQYDYGQVLQLLGVTLPEAYEVHFSNSPRGEAKTAIGNEDGVIIPDEYLLTGAPVYAWLYLHTGENDGETEYRITIPVIARAKPTDAEPTPVQQDAITQAIAALNTAVTESAQSAEAAAGSAELAEDNAELAARYAGTANSAAQSASASAATASTADAFANAAKDAALTAKTAAETARAQAETAATSASGSASAAATSASEAATSATEAEAARDTIKGMSVTAQTLPAGSEATASWADGTLALGIPRGANGVGVPTGGTKGQVMTKASDTDFDTEWTDPVEIDPTLTTSGEAADAKATGDVIRAMCPVATVGPSAIVSVDDAVPLVAEGLVTQIEPVQAGSGDPSPDNVRPISGWASVKVTRTGANLFGGFDFAKAVESGAFPDEFSLNTDAKTFTFTRSQKVGNSYEYPIFSPKVPTKLTAIITYANSGDNASLIFKYTDDSYKQIALSNSNGVKTTAVVSSATGKTVRSVVLSYYANASTTVYYDESGFYEGNVTADDFTPYNGTTIPVTFPASAGTVYGGYVDLLNGKLVVDKQLVTIVDLQINAQFEVGTYACWERFSLPAASNSVAYNQKHGCIASMGVEANAYYGAKRINDAGSANVDFAIDTYGNTLAVYDADLSLTAETFMAKYGSMQVVFPLATPITYDIDPVTLTLLSGDNNIWADTSDTTLTYRQDGQGAVQDVRVNGVSAVTDGVANVPRAGRDVLGVIRANAYYGASTDNDGILRITEASDAELKAGLAPYHVISPKIQHSSAFYGLAKAAGDTTQSASSNPVGQYTESAKSKIQQMLGVGDWVKLWDDTTTEAVSLYTIATDSDGNPFVLRDVIIYVIAAAGTQQTGYMKLFNTNGDAFQVNLGNIVNTGIVRTVIRCELIADSYNIILNTPTNNYREIDKTNAQMYCGLIGALSPSNIIRIEFSVTSLPVGTRIKVYGKQK